MVTLSRLSRYKILRGVFTSPSLCDAVGPCILIEAEHADNFIWKVTVHNWIAAPWCSNPLSQLTSQPQSKISWVTICTISPSLSFYERSSLLLARQKGKGGQYLFRDGYIPTICFLATHKQQTAPCSVAHSPVHDHSATALWLYSTIH